MAQGRFTYFVVFAEMRTGSNFLEENINQFPDLECFGELFNQHFIGGPNKGDVFGFTLKAREKDPQGLLEKMKTQCDGKIPGFRFFNDHDPRILKSCLNDPECGKIILTRNALDSYISHKIAAKTNQWKLTNIKHKKSAQVAFSRQEFEKTLADKQDFQLLLLKGLQTTGQTAFYINYDDIHSLDVLNGLAGYLGSSHRVEGLKKSLKRQNPEPLERKVSNYAEMVTDIGKIDFMNLSRTPAFEPRRGAGVPQYVAGTQSPLLFVPIKGGPVSQIRAWMQSHETDVEGLQTGFNQKTLRQWRQDHAGYQSFTVVRHPVERAYYGFCNFVLNPDNAGYQDLRKVLVRDYGLSEIDQGSAADGYDLKTHKATFLTFLKFIKANLSDQTSLKIDNAWASQTAILEGVSQVGFASHIIQERVLAPSLRHIETIAGLPERALPDPTGKPPRYELSEIYDDQIEARLRDIYTRDYLNFGFASFQP